MENIIENNRLIAEFMEYEMDNVEVIIPELKRFVAFKSQSQRSVIECFETSFFKFDELKFHSSWDWLMPVVDKIESLSYRKTRHFYLYMDYAKVQFKVDRMNIKLFGAWGTNSGAYKLQAVYNAVIEFIKWYNQQNK